MSWGCKAKPNGCGWANRTLYSPAVGFQEWWCDTCERSGKVANSDYQADPDPLSTDGNDPSQASS